MTRRWLFADQLGPHFDVGRTGALLVASRRASVTTRARSPRATGPTSTAMPERLEGNHRMARPLQQRHRLADLAEVVAQERERGDSPP
ncbi:hypothetical protein AB4030_21130 [Terrabacter sp. 2YAF2]